MLCTGTRKFIFRDLKPENIMYDTETKNLKIVDFGSAVNF
jgi:serine/threonine protein kinase